VLGGLVVAVLARHSEQLERLRARFVEVARALVDHRLQPPRLVAQLLFGPPLRRDVVRGAVDDAFARRDPRVPFEPDVAALERLEAAGQRDALARAARQAEDLGGGRVAVVLVDELGQRAPAHRLGRMSEAAPPGRVHSLQAGGLVGRPQQLAGLLEVAGELGLGRDERGPASAAQQRTRRPDGSRRGAHEPKFAVKRSDYAASGAFWTYLRHPLDAPEEMS